MEWISFFFGGVFIANAIPHIGNGVSGRAFQSPFAKPSGEGLSSSLVNVCWGYFNLAVGYVLVFQVGEFDIHNYSQVGALFAGALLISVFMARHFGKFHGGLSR